VTTNESTADRTIRALLAVVAVAAALWVGIGSVAGIVLAVVAAVLGVTAATGFCPLYRVLGISTCRVPAGR
jgi:predicted RND superfamily exporter protein